MEGALVILSLTVIKFWVGIKNYNGQACTIRKHGEMSFYAKADKFGYAYF